MYETGQRLGVVQDDVQPTDADEDVPRAAGVGIGDRAVQVDELLMELWAHEDVGVHGQLATGC